MIKPWSLSETLKTRIGFEYTETTLRNEFSATVLFEEVYSQNLFMCLRMHNSPCAKPNQKSLEL